MEIVESYPLEGLLLLKPRVFADSRGYFMESFNRKTFNDLGITREFVQDNQSRSVKHTLRGLHYQVNMEQAKLVRVLDGEIWDVAVDIRPDSPTYGQWAAATLSAENKHQLYIPRGFAHGFQVVSETAEVLYKCDNYYSPADDRGVMWNDPQLAISWPAPDAPVLSDKDTRHPNFANIRLD